MIDSPTAHPTFSGEAAPRTGGYPTEVSGAEAARDFYLLQQAVARVAKRITNQIGGDGYALMTETLAGLRDMAVYEEACHCKLTLWPVAWYEVSAGMACAYNCPRCGLWWKTQAPQRDLAWVS